MRIISGIYKGRPLMTLSGASTRPTTGRVREAVFNILQQRIIDKTWLDLCAGSGAMALEAVSRGSVHATLVENNPRACQVIRTNIRSLGADRLCQLIPGDAVLIGKRLIGQGRQFDFVYLDPPWSTPNVYENIARLAELLVAKGGLLLIEHPLNISPEAALAQVDSRRYGTTQVSFFGKD